MKLTIQISDGRDMNIDRQDLSSASEIAAIAHKEKNGQEFDRTNGVIVMLRKEDGWSKDNGVDKQATAAYYTDCTEMLRGLAEVLEEERLLSPAIVHTLEDVRCRLQIMPRFAVPLTTTFASSVISLLVGGVAASIQILRLTESWEAGED